MSVTERCLNGANRRDRLESRGRLPRPIAFLEHLHERAPHQIACRRCRIAAGQQPETFEQPGAFAWRVAEQGRRAQGRREQPVARTERGAQRGPKLIRGEWILLKERKLPAVECLTELAILVGERESLAKPPRPLGGDRVDPNRHAGRRRRGDRKHGPDPVGTPIEALEQHRPGGNRSGTREPKGSDGVGELAGRDFRRVYLPLIAPGLASAALLSFILALGYYITPALMGGPKQTMVAAMINQQVMKNNQWNSAAAQGVVLLLVTFAGLLLLKLVGRLGANAKKRSAS